MFIPDSLTGAYPRRGGLYGDAHYRPIIRLCRIKWEILTFGDPRSNRRNGIVDIGAIVCRNDKMRGCRRSLPSPCATRLFRCTSNCFRSVGHDDLVRRRTHDVHPVLGRRLWRRPNIKPTVGDVYRYGSGRSLHRWHSTLKLGSLFSWNTLSSRHCVVIHWRARSGSQQIKWTENWDVLE